MKAIFRMFLLCPGVSNNAQRTLLSYSKYSKGNHPTRAFREGHCWGIVFGAFWPQDAVIQGGTAII